MKRTLITALSVIGVSVVVAAQGPPPGRGPVQSPRPIVAETMPVGGAIEETIHFYHDLLGLEVRAGDPRARLAWYDTRPFLEDMYGGVGGQIRNLHFLTTGSQSVVPGEEMQIEPIEWRNAKGKPLNARPQDPGATRMILRVTDIDTLTGYMKKGGAKVVTTGGAPVTVPGPNGMSRAILFEDGHGFFVELVQPPMAPPTGGTGTANPRRAFVYAADTTVTVADIEESARFFRDVFGLNVTVEPSFHADPKRLEVLGMKGAEYREATVAWPDRTPQLNLVQYRGIEQKTLTPLVADPGATIMRIFVSEMAPMWAKIKAFPNLKVMNVSGAPTTPDARPDGSPWVIIRLPGGTTYLQIVGLANGRVG
jgi:catechol 2,3-dioxygenase-like lactoylglutathione lyase family enzyme